MNNNKKLPLNLSEFYNRTDTHTLKKDIDEYFKWIEKTGKNNITGEMIWDKLAMIFVNQGGVAHFETSVVNIPTCLPMFRIRKLKSMNQIKKLKYTSSYWEKPISNSSKYGRFNKPNENPLYLSFEVQTCLEETRCKDGDIILITKFNPIKNLTLNNVNFNLEDNALLSLDSNGKKAREMYNKFYSKLIYADNELDSNEFAYKQSNIIKEWILNINPNGWIYKSQFLNNRTLNICLESKFAHNNLELSESAILKIVSIKQRDVNVIAFRKKGDEEYIFQQRNEDKKLINLFSNTFLQG